MKRFDIIRQLIKKYFDAIYDGHGSITSQTSRKVSVASAAVRSPKLAKSTPKVTNQQANTPHPGMMGDGTEEQNLNQQGNPGERITQDDVDEAFKKSN